MIRVWQLQLISTITTKQINFYRNFVWIINANPLILIFWRRKKVSAASVNIGTELKIDILCVVESVGCVKNFVVANFYAEMDRKHQFKRKSELANVMREKRRRERRGTSYVICNKWRSASKPQPQDAIETVKCGLQTSVSAEMNKKWQNKKWQMKWLKWILVHGIVKCRSL